VRRHTIPARPEITAARVVGATPHLAQRFTFAPSLPMCDTFRTGDADADEMSRTTILPLDTTPAGPTVPGSA
jgi:hypothetical protein